MGRKKKDYKKVKGVFGVKMRRSQNLEHETLSKHDKHIIDLSKNITGNREATKKEDRRMEKLAKLFSISSKVLLNDIAELLNLTRAMVIEKLIEWSYRFSYEIEGEYLKIKKEEVSSFIDALDEQFAQWEELDGKIE